MQPLIYISISRFWKWLHRVLFSLNTVLNFSNHNIIIVSYSMFIRLHVYFTKLNNRFWKYCYVFTSTWMKRSLEVGRSHTYHFNSEISNNYLLVLPYLPSFFLFNDKQINHTPLSSLYDSYCELLVNTQFNYLKQ